VFFLSGCTAIATQYNLMNRMDSYVFNSSPDTVYAGAVELFKENKIPLKSIGAHKGVSPWKMTYVSQGSLSHYTHIRYTVEVSSIGKNQSIVRVYKESSADKKNAVYANRTLGDEILTAEKIRYIPFEYSTLEKVNPAAAKRMQTRAAK